jgi:predicted esterase
VVIPRVIAAGTHGRYLIEPPASPGPAPILVGFHGYGEGAPAQLERLRRIPGSDRWLLVSIQALHRFYQRRTNEVVASWMTREDRELAIADNLAYVTAVLDGVQREYPAAPRVVFAGFSQGVAMTFRAAAASPRPVDGVIAVGGDVPPDVDRAALARIRRTLLCRGSRDEWYTHAIFERDLERLRHAGLAVQPVEFDGGHEWSDDVVHAAATFLREPEP